MHFGPRHTNSTPPPLRSKVILPLAQSSVSSSPPMCVLSLKRGYREYADTPGILVQKPAEESPRMEMQISQWGTRRWNENLFLQQGHCVQSKCLPHHTRAHAQTHIEVNSSVLQTTPQCGRTSYAERQRCLFLKDFLMHFNTLCTRMFSETGNPSRKWSPAISGVLLPAQRHWVTLHDLSPEFCLDSQSSWVCCHASFKEYHVVN